MSISGREEKMKECDIRFYNYLTSVCYRVSCEAPEYSLNFKTKSSEEDICDICKRPINGGNDD